MIHILLINGTYSTLEAKYQMLPKCVQCLPRSVRSLHKDQGHFSIHSCYTCQQVFEGSTDLSRLAK